MFHFKFYTDSEALHVLFIMWYIMCSALKKFNVPWTILKHTFIPSLHMVLVVAEPMLWGWFLQQGQESWSGNCKKTHSQWPNPSTKLNSEYVRRISNYCLYSNSTQSFLDWANLQRRMAKELRVCMHKMVLKPYKIRGAVLGAKRGFVQYLLRGTAYKYTAYKYTAYLLDFLFVKNVKSSNVLFLDCSHAHKKSN